TILLSSGCCCSSSSVSLSFVVSSPLIQALAREGIQAVMVGKGGEAAASAQHKEEHEEDGDMVGVVKLISAEGFEFVIDKKAAMVSNTLRNMLTSPGILPTLCSIRPSIDQSICITN
uniref:SKP1 component POZ domain-containing protein n=1 Tax=Aegilops tauschii subsp. strangulata TaxID=200361 RepID=A0A453HSE8_AEGTS